MAKSPEQEIKDQYAKVFVSKDWKTFKGVADYYFSQSAKLKKKDISASPKDKLLIRNIQKRLFLGIGTELLVKACYLKNDFAINKPENAEKNKGTVLKLKTIDASEFNPSNTFTLDPLINNLNSVLKLEDWKTVEKGLKILKVFRNKEGHVAVLKHEFEQENYHDIEKAIKSIYLNAFGEKIDFKISMRKDEKGKFKIK